MANNSGDVITIMSEMQERQAANKTLLAEAKVRFNLSRVISQCGTWAITEYGMECLTNYYPIAKDRLLEGEPYYGWAVHMSEKRWIDMHDFCRCLVAARRHFMPGYRVVRNADADGSE